MIFCDSDGVLHAFNAHVESYNKGVMPATDPELWALIDTIPDFWLNMPLMPKAKELIDGLKKFDPVVLTGCPKSNYHVAVDYKRQKFTRNFPGIKVLVCPSKYKPIAAAVHLGQLSSHYLALAQGVFLKEMNEEDTKKGFEELKKVMKNIDLGGVYLIDDMKHNIQRWTKCKGKGIIFTSTEQALDDLKNNKFYEFSK